MNFNETFSDEQLNSLLDNELDDKDRVQIMEAMRHDKELAARYFEFSQNKEMVALAYKNLPSPRKSNDTLTTPSLTTQWYDNKVQITFASLALIIFGGISGWAISSQFINQKIISTKTTQQTALFQTIAQLDPVTTKSSKVLLHINSMDEARVKAVLDKAEKLLHSSNTTSKNPLKLEIIANAKGLGILRLNSPYSERIKSIASQYSNVSFLACGIAKQNARLKEGRDIVLIPQAQNIPAALDRILNRIEEGWMYVRG